ncbi:MAG TPA: hypothetical protein VJS20_06265 [Gemmatimonadales bacterium]|nr:hypothetical protein [Gemmatimonadales bacterium]
MTAPVAMRDIVIVGGGCYGTFYAGQLARAKEKGKASYRQVMIVDRSADCRARKEFEPAADRTFVTADWTGFFDDYLGTVQPTSDDQPADYIVPSPHMPHLMFEWILRRARARWPGRSVTVEPVPGEIDTPYDRTAHDRTRYVSFADWICPTHCVEPVTCPAIGAARTWEMPDSLHALTARLGEGERPVFGPALFVCKHHVFGVGTFAVNQVLAGDAVVSRAGETGAPAAVLVGTVSSCHGAINLLAVGRA